MTTEFKQRRLLKVIHREAKKVCLKKRPFIIILTILDFTPFISEPHSILNFSRVLLRFTGKPLTLRISIQWKSITNIICTIQWIEV